MVKRLGNWYMVEVGERWYNVMVQKDVNKVTCDPSTVLVFDENFLRVNDYTVWDDMEEIMEKMDWKSDILMGD